MLMNMDCNQIKEEEQEDGECDDISDMSERRERVLLRPWLESMIEDGNLPGLEWLDAEKTMFKVPWKHRSKKTWSLRHSSVFLVSLRYGHIFQESGKVLLFFNFFYSSVVR